MKKILITIIAIGIIQLFSQMARAQTAEPANDTWYVWIDVTMPIDGKSTRVISAVPMEITCCLQSAKYRKFVKKAAKWINTNVSSEYNEALELAKIQDLSLASAMIDKAKQSNNARIIEYQVSCK